MKVIRNWQFQDVAGFLLSIWYQPALNISGSLRWGWDIEGMSGEVSTNRSPNYDHNTKPYYSGALLDLSFVHFVQLLPCTMYYLRI